MSVCVCVLVFEERGNFFRFLFMPQSNVFVYLYESMDVCQEYTILCAYLCVDESVFFSLSLLLLYSAERMFQHRNAPYVIYIDDDDDGDDD